MAEISPPRIESISDRDSGPGSEPQGQPPHPARAKAADPSKSTTPGSPEISPPGEDERHNLDEMA